jgi:hypothetical protein
MVAMLKLVRKLKELAVEFCDRWAHVCDARCGAAAMRERALVQSLWLGLRV